MKDRVSTKILNNGATRYGVYDEDGKLLRYEYIKLEDEPDEEGSLWNKANVLPDHIPALLGLKMGNPQVKDALNVLANIGNVHVWKRSWVVSEPVPEVPPGYTLGEVRENVVLASRKTSISTKGTFYYYFGDSVTVKNDGTVNNPPDDAYMLLGRDVSASTVKSGPLFVKGATGYISTGSGYAVADLTSDATKVFYIPAGGTLSVTVEPDPDGSAAQIVRVVATKYQLVNGYPHTPAVPAGQHTEFLTSTQPSAYTDGTVDGITTTYLGQLGEPGAKIEVGSYVGTGTKGENSPCSITAPFEIKAVGIISVCASDNAMLSINDAVGQFWLSALQLTTSYKRNCGLVYGDNNFSNSYAKKSADGKTVYWYNIRDAAVQLNYSGDIHYYIVIG